eukprot:7099684-Prymnesium_polylepis.1
MRRCDSYGNGAPVTRREMGVAPRRRRGRGALFNSLHPGPAPAPGSRHGGGGSGVFLRRVTFAV